MLDPIIEFQVDLSVPDGLGAEQPYQESKENIKLTRSANIPIAGNNFKHGDKFRLYGHQAFYLKKLLLDGQISNLVITEDSEDIEDTEDDIISIFDETMTDGGTVGGIGGVSVSDIPLDDASFAYPSATYCQSGSNPTPTEATPGGTFSSSPTGLTLNPTTGTINVSTSALGQYTLTYTTDGEIPNSSSITMTITNTTPSASFTYSGSFCQNGENPLPVFEPGASAGIFTAGIGIEFVNVNTGEVDLASSTPAMYTITNTIPISGDCDSATDDTILLIIAPDNATFFYDDSTYSKSMDGNPTPTITGLPGGTFTFDEEVSPVNPATGTIILSLISIGTHTITYTTSGTCPDSSDVDITITA